MEAHFIVLPGGGYAAHAENEAEPIVDWLRELGIPATVLRYPLNARHPIPLEAVHSEVRRLRAMGVTLVGAIGFSAGGHLGGHAALSDSSRGDTRIDLAVLGYAITSMEMETYRPARLILLGEDAPPELRRATSLDALVIAGAPPFFIWHTAEDPMCPSSTATGSQQRSQPTTCRTHCTSSRRVRTAWAWHAAPARPRPGPS